MAKKGKVKQKKAQRANKSAALKTRKQSDPEPSDPIISDVEEDSSADETPNKKAKCPHLKCIKMSKVKKMLPHLETGDCYICSKENPSDVTSTIDEKDNGQYLCMTCCKITCSDQSRKHAHEHFEATNKGDPLVINLKTLECWCFRCESEVLPSNKNQVIFDMQTLVEKNLESKALKSVEKSVSGLKLSSKPKLRIIAPGLQNLGNTCFFNSLMQSISATTYLQNLWMPHDEDKKIPHTFGPLNTSMRSMLTSMWTQRGNVVKPAEFFSMIARKWKQFKGFHQQDSHELMRYLFDGLREEQMKASRGGELKDNVESYIDSFFGGKLVSLIVCDICKSVSYSYEDFLDLSLPIDIEVKDLTNKKSRKEKRSKKSSTSVELEVDKQCEETVEDQTENSNQSIETAIPTPSSKYLHFVNSLLSDRCAGMKIEKFSLQNCINKFTTVEELSGDNSYACESCYKYMHPESESKSSGDEPNDVDESGDDHGEEKLQENLNSLESASSVPLSVIETETLEEINEEPLEVENDKDLESKAEIEFSDLKEMTLDDSSDSLVEMDLFDSSESGNASDNDSNPHTVDAFGNSIEKPLPPKKPENPTYIRRTAFRRYLIHTAPKVLVCHLKRFQQYGFSLFR
ncbi:hypothetical protein K7432_015792, partial [Basidiobolus ranarum]